MRTDLVLIGSKDFGEFLEEILTMAKLGYT